HQFRRSQRQTPCDCAADPSSMHPPDCNLRLRPYVLLTYPHSATPSQPQRERMSEAATALPRSAPPGQPAAAANPASRVTELKVSGHLMTLDSGLFCILQTPSATSARDATGLPGVRIS